MKYITRLWTYQNERFPLVIVGATTIAVVLSSYRVVAFPGIPDIKSLSLLIGFTTALLFTFHMRLFDEFKDFEHDKKYYSTRPVSRGLLSLDELKKLTLVVVVVEILLNIFLPLRIFFAYLVSLLYSLIAGKEFFLKNWLRKHFFIYNITHYIQPSLMVGYLYVLFGFHFNSSIVWLHLSFTVFTLILLEWARKMRPTIEENESRDTYSAQLGIVGSSLVFTIIVFIIFFLLNTLNGYLGKSMATIYFSLSILLLTVTSTIFFAIKKNSFASKTLQASSFFYFILGHIIIYFK